MNEGVINEEEEHRLSPEEYLRNLKKVWATDPRFKDCKTMGDIDAVLEADQKKAEAFHATNPEFFPEEAEALKAFEESAILR